MKKFLSVLSYCFLLLSATSIAQSSAPASSQEDLVMSMLNEVGRVVDKSNIKISSSILVESDQTKTLTGDCDFFNLTKIGFAAKFDQGGLIRSFEVSVPVGQKLSDENISSVMKSGEWLKFFLPGDVKKSMLLSKYYINFSNTLTVSNIGVDFSIPNDLPVFGLNALKLTKVGLGYKVSDPLGQSSISGIINATVRWGVGSNPISLMLQSNLVKNPKDWELKFELGNLSINSIAENLEIDKSLIPANVNSLLTLNSARLTVKPCSYSFIFDGASPLGNINIMVKRVTLDNLPVPADTININTSLTGGYSSTALPAPLPPDHPDAPPTTSPTPPATTKSYKWGVMAGFSLPESNDDVKAIRYMRKIGLTNIALVISTFDDAVETNLPIFANLGSGNTKIQKGLSFVAWIPVEDLLTKYKLTQPLRAFAPEFMKLVNSANPIRSVMFRANVPAATTGEFNLEGDISFNDNMALAIKGTEIGRLSALKLGLMISPASQTAEFSFGANWSMLLDPTQKKPLDFSANIFVKPGVDGSATLGFTGAMLSNWENVYGLQGIGFNSLKFKTGLSFASATSYIPIPDDIFFAGQMKYGAIIGDMAVAVNYNELSQNMLLARFCQLSLANVIDQFLSGTVKTKYSSKKNAYVNVLNDFLNMELKDVYFKIVPPNAPTSLASGLKLEADYTKNCNTSLKLGDSWTPGIRMAAEGKFAGWNGYFDIGVEGSLSSLSGGLTLKGKMDPIKISANGFKIFHLSGYKESDPFELFVDLSTSNLIKGVSGLLSEQPGGLPLAEPGSDRLFYLGGSLTILEVTQAKTLVELTPTGYKFKAAGKIYKFLDGTIDASIGSFRDILNTSNINVQVNVGAIQQKIMDKLSSALGDIPFFDELKKGFSIKSISFGGKLAMLQSSATAKVEFKIAGQSFSPSITISMGNSIDFLVNTIVDKIKDVAKDAIQFAKKTFYDAIEIAKKAAETMKDVADKAIDLAKNITEDALKKATELKNTLTNVAQDVAKSTKDAFVKMGEKTKDFFVDFGKFTKKTVEMIYNKSIDRIKDGWKDFTKAVKDAFTGGDNEERIAVDGPAFRIITRYKDQVLSATPNIKKNWPVMVKPRNNNMAYLEAWQLVPNDKNEEGSFYLVSGYNALLVTTPWTTHNVLIPHESDHKDRERMLMEAVPNEPGWFYLRFRDINKDGTSYYIEAKSVALSDIRDRPGFQVNVPQMVLAPVPYQPTRRPGDMGKFKFEKLGDIDWVKAKNVPPPMTPAPAFVEGGRYQFNGQPEQFIFTNGTFRWIPDWETLVATKFDSRPLVVLPNNQQVSTVIGTPYPSRKNGALVQAAGDPKVYIMENGNRRWIPDLETFNLLSLNNGMIQAVSQTDLDAIPLGDVLPSKFNPAIVLAERALYRQTGGDGAVYVVINKTLRWIPNEATLMAMGYKWSQVKDVSAKDISTLPKGTILPSRENGTILNITGQVQNYIMENGIRRLIPDAETLSAMNPDAKKIQKVSVADMNDIPIGPPLISLK